MRRALAPALTAVCAAALLAPALPAGAQPVVADGVERLAGPDRYATAAALAADAPTGRPVVLAVGTNFPDALAAAALGHPVLLAGRDSLPAVTRDALARLRPSQVLVAGGPAALSAGVERDAGRAAGAPTRRLSGPDRYATAASFAAELGRSDTAVLATGLDFPDALSAGSYACSTASPVLLSGPDALPGPTRDALRAAQVERVVVVGSPEAVTPAVLDGLRRDGYEVLRVAGPDRYATAQAVTDVGLGEGALDPQGALLARGDAFPDVLAAGPYACSRPNGAVALDLVTPSGLPGATAYGLDARADTLTSLTVVGGTSAVPSRVVRAARDVAGGYGARGQLSGAPELVEGVLVDGGMSLAFDEPIGPPAGGPGAGAVTLLRRRRRGGRTQRRAGLRRRDRAGLPDRAGGGGALDRRRAPRAGGRRAAGRRRGRRAPRRRARAGRQRPAGRRAGPAPPGRAAPGRLPHQPGGAGGLRPLRPQRARRAAAGAGDAVPGGHLRRGRTR